MTVILERRIAAARLERKSFLLLRLIKAQQTASLRSQ